MKKAFGFLAVILTMSGCVVDRASTAIDRQLNTLQGQPVKNAFYRLGYPTGESGVANTKFYYWSTSGVIMEPTTIETTGVAQVGRKTVSYDQTTFGPDQAIPVACTIRIFVDPRENIIAHDSSGDQPGCVPYAQKLDPNYSPRVHFIY